MWNGGKRLVQWAEERLDRARFREDAVTIGVTRGGEVAAVAVYDTFTTTSCMVHLVSDGSKRWMTREFLRAGFSYPFIQCGFRNIFSIVSEHNEAALKLDFHLGWEKLAVLPEDGLDGEDNFLLHMSRRKCRWIPQTFHKTARPAKVGS